MEPNPTDDIFFAASVLIFTAVSASISPCELISIVGIEEIRSLYKLAYISHCLPFEYLAHETGEKYGFAVDENLHSVHGDTAAGRVLADMVIASELDEAKYPEKLYALLSDEELIDKILAEHIINKG